ncbi:MAG: tetratricopeptide repeat protein [Anaerolineae bacterium]|nr:tetratricopeptide repeat protein [Anaerolineae bacterium]
MLELTLLGPPLITLDGKPVTDFVSRKALLLACYLALEGEHAHTREKLGHLLWGEKPDRRARASLSLALHNIQKLLPDYLIVTSQTIAFDTARPCRSDVAVFREALEKPETDATRLEEAIELYRGQFLGEHHADDSPEMGDWLSKERRRYQSLLLSGIERLADHYTLTGQWKRAADLIRQALDMEPWHETFHQQLMLFLARQGKYNDALAHYKVCCQALEEELGVPPSAETVALHERIRKVRMDRRHNLPPAPGKFVGRQADLDRLTQWIYDTNRRLITLVGPGGIGKTRLAQELAARHAHEFINGAWHVSLVSTTEPALIVTAIAEAVGIQLSGTTPLREQLFEQLAGQELLLVLDSFEHLVDSANLVTGILHSAPDVKVIVTSREKLDLRDEWAFRVDGLSLPPEEADQADKLECYDAIACFVQRARQQQHDFAIRGQETAVVQMCRLLGGSPLGIELAAALLPAASCAQIVTEVERSLDVLDTNRQDVPERHRSLRAVFDHSWHLLTPEEQQVFPRLSVFSGGFTFDAAQKVANADLIMLSGLIAKSLLRVSMSEDNTIARYDIHENVRQYAEEILCRDPAAQQQAQVAHIVYYVDFLQKQEDQGERGEYRAAIDAIYGELGNIWAVWQRAVAYRDTKAIDRTIRPLTKFHEARGWFQQAYDFFTLAIEGLQPEQTSEEQFVCGRLLVHRAGFQTRLGQIVEAQQYAQQGVEILRQQETGKSLAVALNILGVTQSTAGLHSAAQEAFRESLAIFRTLGQRQGYFSQLLNLGITSFQMGDYQAAKEALEDGLAFCREEGIRQDVAYFLDSLGILYLRMRDLPTARSYCEQALLANEEAGHNVYLNAGILINLGEISVWQGRFEQAVAHCQAALTLLRPSTELLHMSAALKWLGVAHHYLGEDDTAYRCLCEGLEIHVKMQNVTGILRLFVGVAMVMLDSENHPAGIELLRIVAQHPATEHGNRLDAVELLSRQGIEVPEEVEYQEDRPLVEIARDVLLKLRTRIPDDAGVGPNPDGGGQRSQNGPSCPNPDCELHSDVDAAQIVRFGKTKGGAQRYRCLACGQTFTETVGTIFYRKQVPRETILEALALLARGARISHIARIKGIKEDTILDWLRAAADQSEAIEETLQRDYRLNREQIEHLWAYLGYREAASTGQTDRIDNN